MPLENVERINWQKRFCCSGRVYQMTHKRKFIEAVQRWRKLKAWLLKLLKQTMSSVVKKWKVQGITVTGLPSNKQEPSSN